MSDTTITFDLEKAREVLKVYASGACYCCRSPLKADVRSGCVVGNCSYRPARHTPDYDLWHARAQLVWDLISVEGP